MGGAFADRIPFPSHTGTATISICTTDVGDDYEAARLQLPGADGYPDVDNMYVLATMYTLCIELHSLTFDLPVQAFGHGSLVRIGHMA